MDIFFSNQREKSEGDGVELSKDRFLLILISDLAVFPLMDKLLPFGSFLVSTLEYRVSGVSTTSLILHTWSWFPFSDFVSFIGVF